MAARKSDKNETPMPEPTPERDAPETGNPLASRVAELEDRVTVLENAAVELNETAATLAEQNVEIVGQMHALERSQGSLAYHVPRGPSQRMTKAQVEARIKDDHRSRFEVLRDYSKVGTVFRVGQVITAQHYPNVASHVANGLQLAEAAPE